MPLTSMSDTARLTERELIDFEGRWDVVLPEQYRQFLLKYDGGSPEPFNFRFKNRTQGSSLDCFYGVMQPGDQGLDDALNTFGDRIPARFFPIACDQGGNLVCISLSDPDSGKVYFWDHELEADVTQGFTPDTTKNLILVADSFEEFIEQLF